MGLFLRACRIKSRNGRLERPATQRIGQSLPEVILRPEHPIRKTRRYVQLDELSTALRFASLAASGPQQIARLLLGDGKEEIARSVTNIEVLHAATAFSAASPLRISAQRAARSASHSLWRAFNSPTVAEKKGS